MRTIVLVAIARAADVVRSWINECWAVSAEKPFAPKRGETKIALNYHQQRRASVADETSTKRSCAFGGGSTSVCSGPSQPPFWRVKQKGLRRA